MPVSMFCVTAASILLAATPPEDGFSQRFVPDRSFTETLDVRVHVPGPSGPTTTMHYKLDLTTTTADVESSEQALLRSTIDHVFAETTVGETLTAHYDSSERRTIGAISRETADSDVLADQWAPLHTIRIDRTATTSGQWDIEKLIGLPISSRDTPTDAAVRQSLTTILSWPLPAGPVDSWTDEVDWPLGSETVSALRLMTYTGLTKQGLERIELSLATKPAEDAIPTNAPELIGRGSLLFSPDLGRVVAIDLLLESASPQLTRTNIAWRLQPSATTP